MKSLFLVPFFLILAIKISQAQLITNFGVSAADGGGWSYNSGSSTLTGTEGAGDLIFGSPLNFNLNGATSLSLTANVITAPSSGFSIVLEDSSFATATALFDWADFVGGATINSSIIPDLGFDPTNIVGWSLFGGGSGQSIDATLTTLSAVPEPSTYALIGLGLGGLVLLRRKAKKA